MTTLVIAKDNYVTLSKDNIDSTSLKLGVQSSTNSSCTCTSNSTGTFDTTNIAFTNKTNNFLTDQRISGFIGIGKTPTIPFDLETSNADVTVRWRNTNTVYGPQFALDATGAGGQEYRLVSTPSGNGYTGAGYFSIWSLTSSNYILKLNRDGKLRIGSSVGNTAINDQLEVLGNISATGNVSAQYFIGDGSKLTNISSSGGSMDYTNLAMTNSTPNFTQGIRVGGGNITISTTNPAGFDMTRTLTSGASVRNFVIDDTYIYTTSAGQLAGGLFRVQDHRTITSGTSDTAIALTTGIMRQASNWGGTGGTMQPKMTSLANSVYNGGTYNRTLSNTIITDVANDLTCTIIPVMDVSSARILTYNYYGQRSTTSVLTPTYKSGTFKLNYYSYSSQGTGVVPNITVGYGYYNSLAGFGTNWGFYNDATSNNYMGKDNSKTYFGTMDSTNSYANASIGWDGSNLVIITNESGGNGYLWISNNISTTGVILRTSTYDKNKGKALDKVKDADAYKNPDGSINHSAFYGYTKYKVTDKSRPIIVNITNQNCFTNQTNNKEECNNVSHLETTYPYQKDEEGVNLEDEVNVLRQSVYELKKELCLIKPNAYSFCGEFL